MITPKSDFAVYVMSRLVQAVDRRGMNIHYAIRLLLATAMTLVVALVVVGQSGRPDDPKRRPTPTPTPAPAPSPSNVGKRIPYKPKVPKPDPVASLIIRINPADSVVLVDGIQAAMQLPGVLRIDNLKVSVPHTIVARRTGYGDLTRTIKLGPGANFTETFNLQPLPGSLSVITDAKDAEIVVRRSDTNSAVTTRMGSIANLELATGPYAIEVSKAGFQSIQRDVFILPGQAIYLEPRLVPIERPRPVAPRRNPVPMTAVVRLDGKYLLVTIQGAANDTREQRGAVTIQSSKTAAQLSGWLPGLPCAIELVRIANIAEASLVEAPGPTNQWSRAIFRVRPKDQKELVSFGLNWQTLSGSVPTPETNVATGTTTNAVVLVKAQPAFPAAARSMRIAGSVTVLVAIDEYGTVISAKAIDGPLVFYASAEQAARRWKFAPAMQDGKPVSSSQKIVFTYQL